MQELHSHYPFFRYDLVPAIGQDYLLSTLWHQCSIEYAMSTEQGYNGWEAEELHPKGWEEVIKFLNPLFRVEAEAGFMTVTLSAEIVGTLTYAYQHLRQGAAAQEVIAKLDQLGTTYIHRDGSLDI
jgi:hypothetical protein